ncbi:50S ribosomal protein L25 [Clostridium polynesiense]|uniref:50S ribosomal protein L25 n=1 Tax=Clostridium polynesiense TaxID=1325933 RepID=UPI0006941F82|nr:50S ribosomal protein L25 [Clostridium polynesiense]
MSQSAINVMERNPQERVKALRRDGIVPGIIYGSSMDKNIPIKVDSIELARVLKYNSKGSILKLEINDKKWSCLVKEVQKEHLGDGVIHVDFQHVKSDEVVKMNIPITYTGRENLQLNRLVLESLQPELELQGPAEDIPLHFDIDVSQMQFEDKLYAKDIKLPDNITLLTDPETLLAVVNASVMYKDLEETAEADASESGTSSEA